MIVDRPAETSASASVSASASASGHDGAVTDPFATARSRLVGIAYRLVGTTADAEDVVQDAWIRWQRADRARIDNADAWLTTVVTRLALDRLRQRKREEDRYLGPWLPTPIVDRVTDGAGHPESAAELADSMTTAFLLLLERLTPDERAVFLLSDVFGESFRSIAATMDRSDAACRQLASRARRKLRETDDQPLDTGAAARQVIDRFLVALATGDEVTALACVAEDAVLISDGGPHRRAARRPVIGADRILRLFATLQRRAPASMQVESAIVGGSPGFVVLEADGHPNLAVAFEVADGRIRRLLLTLNPDKLDAVWRDRSTIR